jgi:hypothetical protein
MLGEKGRGAERSLGMAGYGGRGVLFGAAMVASRATEGCSKDLGKYLHEEIGTGDGWRLEHDGGGWPTGGDGPGRGSARRRSDGAMREV